MRRTFRRRRKEQKTDYRARLALLKSRKPRLVIRKTNRGIIVQIAESEGAQDKVVFHITSKDLIARGWPKESEGSLKSLPAAYLTGFLAAKKAKEKIKEAILDIGLQRNIPKSRIYAVLKGAVDAGLKVPHNPDVFPTEEMFKKHKLNKLMEGIKHKL
ncbi:50S ribosomal protein L18 [Candidatus Pacearchaeota archaeon]|nr:50S ribosomal protein L18 [Candidatus Pacearchaeota archaeon]